MPDESPRLLLDVAHRYVWAWVVAVGGFGLLVFSGIDRLLDWDEAVFFSQSGGYLGVPAPPVFVSPSREGGPIGLIATIRWLGFDLHGVRAVWVLLVLFGAAFAFWAVSRHVGRRWGLVGLAVYLSFWITWVASGFLHGPMIAGISGLLALAAYDTVVHAHGARRQVVAGIFLGMALSLMFWFRPVESGTIAVGILAFSLVFDARTLWLQRSRAWLASGITVLGAFFIPWGIWSTIEFGSIAARFEGMVGQTAGGRWRLHWGVPDWINMVSGHKRAFGLFASMPTWSNPLIALAVATVFVALAVVTVGGIGMWRRGERDAARVRLLAAVAFIIPTVLYLLLRVDVTERYASLWWIYGSWLIGLAARDAWTARASHSTGRNAKILAVAAATVLAIIWFTAQVGLARGYQDALLATELDQARPAQVAGTFMNGAACTGGAPANVPLHQILSGCKMVQVKGANDARTVAVTIESRSDVGYLFASNAKGSVVLGPDWRRIEGIDWGRERTLWIYSASPSR